MSSRFVFQGNKKLQLEIGATMRIRYGTTNTDYVKSSRETARDILGSDQETDEEVPTTATQVVRDLTQ